MDTLDIFEKQFGKKFALSLAEAQFWPAGEDDPVASYRFVYRVGISHAHNGTPEELEAKLGMYTAFFEELVSKLQDQALQLARDVTIPSDMTVDAVRRMRTMLGNVFLGGPMYGPFLMDTVPDSVAAIQKGVTVALVINISKVGRSFPKRTLRWLVFTQPFQSVDGKDGVAMQPPIEISKPVRRD